MKKILFTIAIVLTMVLGANAQTDGFFTDGGGDAGYRGVGGGGALPGLPQGSIGEHNNDQPAPVGSGLLILTALGAGYAISRKNTKQE